MRSGLESGRLGATLRSPMEAAAVDELAAPPGIEVRAMRADDLEAVVAIEREAFTTPWQLRTFRDLLGRSAVELLVMEDAGEGVVGYAVLWCILEQGELANVAVAPSRRGQGLGRYLIAQVLRVARGRGVRKLYLEVRASNARAAELYRAFGFADVGVRHDYYDHPKEDARVMMATLA